MKPWDIRLIAFDLDGTALNSSKQFSERTLRAVRAAIKAGKYIVPCTGRQIYNIPPGLLETPGISFVITDNGASVYGMPERGILYARTFDAETALAILALSRCLNAFCFGTNGVEGALDEKGQGWHEEESLEMIRQHRRVWNPALADLVAWVREGRQAFNKMTIIFANPMERMIAYEQFSGIAGADITSSDIDNLELMPRGTSKADALRFVAKKINVDMGQIMAIGDNYNDMEMIKSVGYGVAMGNGVDVMRQAAAVVTASCDDDGVAKAIESILADGTG
ncbi:MAG: Cof-type HAD-IIB family hydrolase [Spirochaetaceae bacterium]|jgi:Cof subfamily protein (haloacid dehalogenase superfamily)|nr:Cof-type HAD-IIB family hydrolase [Spirochaetaceae bacterium]